MPNPITPSLSGSTGDELVPTSYSNGGDEPRQAYAPKNVHPPESLNYKPEVDRNHICYPHQLQILFPNDNPFTTSIIISR